MENSREKLLENMKAELAKIGIFTAEDLDRAIRDLPPLDLGIMVGKINGGRGD